MNTRALTFLAVTFLSACGTRAQHPVTPNAAAASVPESKTSDDYVVGPFVTPAGPRDDDAVRTYYIVRN